MSKFDRIAAMAVTVCFCLTIISSTLGRYMNYFNLLAVIVMLYLLVARRYIVKSKVCLLWFLFILIYPICDACFRGESGLSLYTALGYLVVLLLLVTIKLPGDIYGRYFLKALKFFSLFQVFGVFLSKIWYGLYVKITWHLLGTWYSTVSGFAVEKSVTSYYLCLGFGIVFFEIFSCKCFNKKMIILFLQEICIFIALNINAKRSYILCAVISCFVISVIISLCSARKLFTTCLVAFVGISAFFAICYISYLSGSENALGRLGATFVGVSNGEDVSSMRSTWSELMKSWRQGHELIGIGWESFPARLLDTEYAGQIPNGHNVYKQIFCEAGIVGESFWIFNIALTILISIKKILDSIYDKHGRFIFVVSLYIILTFVIYCDTGNAIYDEWAYLPFFGAIRLLYAEEATLRNKSRE